MEIGEKRGPAGLNVLEAAKIAGVGRSTIYEELASGRLSARKLGRRTIIPEHSLRVWLDSLPAYRPLVPTPKGNLGNRELPDSSK
jgi:excisionase family DNA binding protein